MYIFSSDFSSSSSFFDGFRAFSYRFFIVSSIRKFEQHCDIDSTPGKMNEIYGSDNHDKVEGMIHSKFNLGIKCQMLWLKFLWTFRNIFWKLISRHFERTIETRTNTLFCINFCHNIKHHWTFWITRKSSFFSLEILNVSHWGWHANLMYTLFCNIKPPVSDLEF